MLGHATYTALASGFLMTDVLALRTLLTAGYSGLAAFHALQAKPLWIPLGWSCVFVAVNAAFAANLAADRWGSLNEEEEKLHTESFPQLTRGQFKQLLAIGERVELPRGSMLTTEEEHCEFLYFLVDGTAKL